MRIFIIVILSVYLFAINFYGFLLVKRNRDAINAGNGSPDKKGKLFLTGTLGGALGVYISMIVFKYKIESLLLMALMPVLIALTAFLVYSLASRNFLLPLDGGNNAAYVASTEDRFASLR